MTAAMFAILLLNVQAIFWVIFIFTLCASLLCSKQTSQCMGLCLIYIYIYIYIYIVCVCVCVYLYVCVWERRSVFSVCYGVIMLVTLFYWMYRPWTITLTDKVLYRSQCMMFGFWQTDVHYVHTSTTITSLNARVHVLCIGIDWRIPPTLYHHSYSARNNPGHLPHIWCHLFCFLLVFSFLFLHSWRKPLTCYASLHCALLVRVSLNGKVNAYR